MEELSNQPTTLAAAMEAGLVEVTIDGLGFRGEGYVEFEDGWLSVPGALPGEVVLVDVEAPKRHRPRRVFGTLREITKASVRRSDPHCDRVDHCRGCQLRHVAVVDELQIKTRTVVECLEKFAEMTPAEIGEVETLTVPGATRADAFRVRTSLSVRAVDGAWQMGIHAPNQRLIDMSTCPALTDSVTRSVARVSLALRSLPTSVSVPLRQIRVASPVHGHGYVDVDVERHDEAFGPLLAALDRELPAGFGIAITDGTTRRHLRGPQRFRIPMADLRLEVGFDDWFHATLEPAEQLYDSVEEWLGIAPGERVIDAGCGVGTIGLVCARAGAEVVGFDVNRFSVETAELNAMNNDLHVEFRCGGWERAFRELVIEKRTFDTIVINPMREPLGERPLAYAAPLGAKRVLYLGPAAGPASKDIGALRSMGWKLTRVAAANLHPATYHVMLVALLER